MDEKSRSLVSVITDERIKADILLRRPQSMFASQPLLPSPPVTSVSEKGCDSLLKAQINVRESLSIFLVAVLVIASCIAVAHGAITGTILAKTLLQVAPGSGTTVLTTLSPRTVVSVMCRRQSDIVFDDPWWLKVSVPSTRMTGWVTDYYVDCGDVGNCNVAQC